MKHASPATLAALHPLLEQLRLQPHLVERRPGTFYLKARAFLHFHEDPTGIHADIRLDGVDFCRFGVTTAADQAALLAAVGRTLTTPDQ
jgi:hypothetical protein